MGNGGTASAHWRSDTLPCELVQKNVLEERRGGEIGGLFSLEDSRVREGSRCVLHDLRGAGEKLEPTLLRGAA